ncbi:MAG: hypothetical protein JRI54_00130 [Deltaproteobacteria bacterium]|nr:hypothetical protein [Deltaproteobacteria bacterium]
MKKIYFLIIFLLIASGCSMLNLYSITIKHKHSPEVESVIKIRNISSQNDMGHVYAGYPYPEAKSWYAWAEVYDSDGNKIKNPTIEWSTNFPEGITWEKDPVRNNGIYVMPKAQKGRGKLFAKYQEETAELTIIAYGYFKCIHNNTDEHQGWSFSSQSFVSINEADVYIETYGASHNRTKIIAPYGIKKLEDSILRDAYFEKYNTPSSENFITEIMPPNGIFEVIAADGVHYKLSAFTYSHSSTISEDLKDLWENTVEFAWDHYSEQ